MLGSEEDDARYVSLRRVIDMRDERILQTGARCCRVPCCSDVQITSLGRDRCGSSFPQEATVVTVHEDERKRDAGKVVCRWMWVVT